MNYLIEALFIGIYTSILSLIINLFKFDINININLELFLIGFLKHFTGFFIGLHKYYCNNNNFIEIKNNNFNYSNEYIISQSIYEGILFIIIGNIFIYLNINIKNKIIIYFFIGFILHIISENLGYHKYFILRFCKKKK